MTVAAPGRERWFGLDLVRLVCIFLIAEFHFGLLYFGEATTKFIDESWILWTLEQLGRIFMNSGFIIVFLSSLLLALNMRNPKKKMRLFGVLFLGWVYLSIGAYSPFVLTWDVFALFFSGILSILLFQRVGGNMRVLGVVGYCLCWLPIWEFGPYLPYGYDTAKQILGVASCANGEVSEWPLLPWVGLVWFGYWVGHEVKWLQDSNRLDVLYVRKKEGFAWAALLLLGVPNLGPYYRLRMGHYFSCEAYRQPPVVFWSLLVWALLAIRLSFDPRIQAALSRQRWVHMVSGLAISRKFWLAYAVEYMLSMGLATCLNYWEDADPASFARWEMVAVELIGLTILIQTELISRGLIALGAKIMAWAGPVLARRRLGAEARE